MDMVTTNLPCWVQLNDTATDNQGGELFTITTDLLSLPLENWPPGMVGTKKSMLQVMHAWV